VFTVAAGPYPFSVAVNRKTNRACVGNLTADTVTVIRGRSGHTSTIKVSPYLNCIVVNERTNKICLNHQVLEEHRNKIYVAEWNTRVTIIDGATSSTTTVPNPGYNSRKIVAHPLANEFYTLNMATNIYNSYPPSSVSVFVGPKQIQHLSASH
jgi:DNA-binding beta-propeller fold protein YncE